MIDCGEGAQLSFQRKRLKFSRLNHIFLTHLHGDHVFGLPGLIGTLSLQQIGGSITIHTFEEGREILSRIFSYFSQNLTYDITWDIIDPLKEQMILETRTLTVRTIPLQHRVPAVGYVFEEKPGMRHLNREMADFHGVPVSQFNNIKAGHDFIKDDGSVVRNSLLTSDADPALSYAHISDTKYMPQLAGKIANVDLLMHETTYLNLHEADAAARGHSTAAQAAMTARDAGAKALLTGHYSSRYNDDLAFAIEATRIFPNVILNDEGLTVDLHNLTDKSGL